MVDTIVPAELPILHRVPASIAREIGRVIVSFAHLEWMVDRMLYFVLDVDDDIGRISVKDQDGAEQFKLLRRLLRLKGITVKMDLNSIAADIRSCQAQRNDIAHSVWLKSPYTNNLMICLFRGEWSKEDDVEEKSRKLNPEGRPYPLEEAITLVRRLDDTIGSLGRLYNELYGILRASPQISRAPSHPD